MHAFQFLFPETFIEYFSKKNLPSLQLAAKMNSNAVTDPAFLQSKDATVVTIAKTEPTKPIVSQNAVLENSVATQANASATAENVTDTLTAAMEVMKMIAVSFKPLI